MRLGTLATSVVCLKDVRLSRHYRSFRVAPLAVGSYGCARRIVFVGIGILILEFRLRLRFKMTFDLEILDGSPSEFHQSHSDPPNRRIVSVCRPMVSGLVMGSTQLDFIDRLEVAYGHSFEVFRRSSGGGGVVICPGNVIWIDVGLPPHDPMIIHDVTHSFLPIAKAWQDALLQLGVEFPQIHSGGMRRNSDLQNTCFASLGPGEITVDGQKLVGMAQRRKARGSYFHTMAYLDFPFKASTEFFEDGDSRKEEILRDVATDLRSVFKDSEIPSANDFGESIRASLTRSAS